jgi:isopenicillin N synthase-like dioxygenase
MSIVILKYEDLVTGKDLSEEIFEAFGPNGLGALTISGIPGYSEARNELLSLGHTLAHLPEDKKAKLEHPASMYNVGWSFGKEKLGDKPDLSKGSFYANPLYDHPSTEEENKKYPFWNQDNIWPTEDVPGVEPALKKLGKIMFDATILLTKHVDSLIAKRVPTYNPTTLYDSLSTTKKIKGRVLYYYPCKSQDEDGWIGWHNDSGFLTALTSEIFLDDTTGKRIENPDPKGGLWIVDRKGGNVKVNIPPENLAIQCGECLQIISGGILVATPHCVKASQSDSVQVGRATFPVFIDTHPEFKLQMPKGLSRENVFDKTMHSRVPPLQERWTEDGVEFVKFLGDTFKKYYEYATK